MTKLLETVEDVITALDGPEEVAKLTDQLRPKGSHSPSLVPTWKYRGEFPPKTYSTIKRELEKRGFDAPNSLWGMP